MKKHNQQLNKKNNKKNSNSRTPIIIAIVCLLAVVVTFGFGIKYLFNAYLYGGCTTDIDENLSYEQLLLGYISRSPYKTHESSRINSVKVDYVVDPNPATQYVIETNFHNEPFTFEILEPLSYPEVTEENTTFTEFSKPQQNMIRSAKNLVIQYINTSEILKDKELLIQEIENIPFYLYTESSVEDLNIPWVPAQHKGYGIYCNKNYSVYLSEAIFVHELVHHLSYVTNGYKTGDYCGFMLDETITEIITNYINPIKNPDVEVDYVYFMSPVYSYLTIFGRDAIEAYFYGYDDFFQNYGGKTFKDEHDAFVAALNSYTYYQYAYDLTEAFFGTWHARLYEK